MKRPHMMPAFKGSHSEADEHDIRQLAAMTPEESVRNVLELQRLLGWKFETIRRPDCRAERGNWPRLD